MKQVRKVGRALRCAPFLSFPGRARTPLRAVPPRPTQSSFGAIDRHLVVSPGQSDVASKEGQNIPNFTLSRSIEPNRRKD